MLMTGEAINAQKAYDWGMINRVCETDELE